MGLGLLIGAGVGVANANGLFDCFTYPSANLKKTLAHPSFPVYIGIAFMQILDSNEIKLN